MLTYISALSWYVRLYKPLRDGYLNTNGTINVETRYCVTMLTCTNSLSSMKND